MKRFWRKDPALMPVTAPKKAKPKRPGTAGRPSDRPPSQNPGKRQKPARKARPKAEWAQLGAYLDALVARYKTPAYIEADPIQFPHRFAHDPRACELSAFIAALFSYGRRESIIETLNTIFRLTDQDPAGFLASFHPKKDARLFSHFVYRFNTGEDLVFLWRRLQWVYREYGSLENLMASQSGGDLKARLAGLTDALLDGQPPPSYGVKFLFAHPKNGGACKRMNMFLRWMVRQDVQADSRVDLGLWQHALSPSDLVVPLDTHVLKMNRLLELTPNQSGTWQTAQAITDVFRRFDPVDPVRYDYALFGFSVAQGSDQARLADWRAFRENRPSIPFMGYTKSTR